MSTPYPTHPHEDLAEVVQAYRRLADGSMLYSVPFTEMTREELLAVAAFLLTKMDVVWRFEAKIGS